MADKKYKFDFGSGLLVSGFWASVFLAILKITNVIDISIWWVLLPFLIALGLCALVIFVIGLVFVYILSVRGVSLPEDLDSEEDDDEDE